MQRKRNNRALTLLLRFIVSIFVSYKFRLRFRRTPLTFDLRFDFYFHQGRYISVYLYIPYFTMFNLYDACIRICENIILQIAIFLQLCFAGNDLHTQFEI